MENKLRLYVWNDFSSIYTSGLAFAIAESESMAKQMIQAQYNFTISSWGVCHVYNLNERVAYSILGDMA